MGIEMQLSSLLLLLFASFHNLHDVDCAVIQSHVTINDRRNYFYLMLNQNLSSYGLNLVCHRLLLPVSSFPSV